MHRKIRAVVQADNLDDAVATAADGLEAAMADDILPTGTVRTLVGDYDANEPFGPSTYFTDDREQAGYRTTSDAGRRELDTAVQDMHQHGSTFVYSIGERDGALTATPHPSEDAVAELRTTLQSKPATHWVVTFDLRYDFDATPHKPNEILKRD